MDWPWEDRKPGKGRRGCPLQNVTASHRHGLVYREDTCKQINNDPNCQGYGWTPPASPSLAQKTVSRNLQVIFQPLLIFRLAGGRWEKKKTKQKLHLISTRTKIINEFRRLRVKTKMQMQLSFAQSRKDYFFKAQKVTCLRYEVLRIKKSVDLMSLSICLPGVKTEMRKNQ